MRTNDEIAREAANKIHHDGLSRDGSEGVILSAINEAVEHEKNLRVQVNLDWAEDDTKVKELCRPFLGDAVDTDGHSFRTVVGVTELMVQRMEQMKQQIKELREALEFYSNMRDGNRAQSLLIKWPEEKEARQHPNEPQNQNWRNCPRCFRKTVIEDGYCGGPCRECTLPPIERPEEKEAK